MKASRRDAGSANDNQQKNNPGPKIFRIFVGITYAGLLFQVILSQTASLSQNNSNNAQQIDLPSSSSFDPFAIKAGQAPNLPSIRVADDSLESKRNMYGGRGDKKHLGGFTEIDTDGISPATWKHMVNKWTVQSVLDVGCGRGTSTSWFVTHGLRTQCVEGSHDAVERSMVPDKESVVVEHDFSRGPWWPGETFDAVWAVEFLEHVNIHDQFNYVSAFRKAAILMVTSSKWGGWHHVEVHNDAWWIRKYESYGFVYDAGLTQEIRNVALLERNTTELFPPTQTPYAAFHVINTMKVFVNPRIAAMPRHNHLFGEPGCYHPYTGGDRHRECAKAQVPKLKKDASTETALKPSFYPLNITTEQDEAWYKIVSDNIPLPKTPPPRPPK